MREQLNEAVEAVRRAAEALDADEGSPAQFYRALDRLHAEVRAHGGRSPMWNSIAGAVSTHIDSLLATIPVSPD